MAGEILQKQFICLPMKTFITILLSLFSLQMVFAQQTIIEEKFQCLKINLDGINDSSKADYFSQTLEKNGIAVFCGISDQGSGYIIIDSARASNSVCAYIDHCNKGFKVKGSELVPLTDALFLQIYFMRLGIPAGKQSITRPLLVKLGPKRELSTLLHQYALKQWDCQYLQNK